MTFRNINKAIYRKHLNIVIVLFIASFTGLAIGYGALLIHFFGNPAGDHFVLNLLGVIFAFITCASVLVKQKNSPFFDEIYYVWQLKQCQNKIYRKLKAIQQAAKNNDEKAYVILDFYYASLIQVYTLDDNTITLNDVTKKHEHVLAEAAEKNIAIKKAAFTMSMINEL